MRAIFKRELKSYFHSFIGLLFIGITLFFIGLYFTVYNLMGGNPYFTYTLSGVIFVFLVSVPILTMRVLAEEKKQKTDQLILTAPVSVGEIVIGKFLALSTIFIIPTLITCIYPLVLTAFGAVPLFEAYLGILAFFLYGEVCIAIGLFISAITESQVIAAVITFGVLFLGYMMSSICSILSSDGNWLTAILGCYDFYTAFYNMTQGTINLEAIAYFLSLTALFLFFTVQAIQKRRYSVSVKKLSFGAYSMGMVVVSIVVCIVFNLAVSQIPDSIKLVDVTANKMYSLTDDTKKFLDTVDEDFTIYVMSAEDQKDTTVEQTLERYTDYCKHIKVEYVNPSVNPNFSTKYTQGSMSYGSLIVVGEKRNKVIDANALYETSYDYTNYTSNTTGYDAEGQITSALDYCMSDDVTRIYMTTGHGEASIESDFTSAIQKANMETETLNLMDQETIPDDCACLMINAPISDFSEDDAAKVKDYLNKGGKLIAVYGYTDVEMTNFDALLSYMGLSVTKGLVVETNSQQYYYQSQYLLLPTMEDNALTCGIYGDYYIYAPFAQGIKVDNNLEDTQYDIFLYTSNDAFARLGYENVQALSKTDEDESGPFGIGVSVSKTVGDTSADMILFSCEQLFTNQVNQAVSGANQILFMNTINSFVEEHQSNISIPVKSYNVSNLILTGTQVVFIGTITTVILPLGCIIIGFVIWFRRRRR